MSKRMIYIIYVSFVLLILITSCTTRKGETNETGALTVKAPITSKESWENEWERVQKEARKEGKVVIHATSGGDVRTAVLNAFKDFGIEVDWVSGNSQALQEKVSAERRAGIYNADFHIYGHSSMVTTLKPAGLLAPLEPLLILPEVKNPDMWYKNTLPFSDKEKTIFSFSLYVEGDIHVNTEMAKPEDFKTVIDLLSPRWQGKIIMDDPTTPGRGNQWTSVTITKMGEDFIKQLAKQKPLLTRDKRLIIDWVSKGKYPIGIGINQDQFQEYKRAGAPVSSVVLKEISYLAGGGGMLAYIDRSPHPNASRVFLNWLLSRKGQMVWQRARMDQSARVDVPVDELIEGGRVLRQIGVDYHEAYTEEWVLEFKPRAEKAFMEVFKSLAR